MEQAVIDPLGKTPMPYRLQAQFGQTGARPDIRWRCASSYPKSLLTIHEAMEMVTKHVADLPGGHFNISLHAAGGLAPALQMSACAASKDAIVSLIFSFVREYAAFGVTCNALAPTYVKTRMLTEQVSAERQDELKMMIPVGRFCAPEELAHNVLFLAHPMSGFITGEVLDLNDGLQFD